MRLAGKVAIVTGAAQGIGRATAELFAEHGATVYGTDITESAVSDAIWWRKLDVTKLHDWDSVVSEIVASDGRIDILVNNAGVVHSYDGVAEISLESWRTVLDVDLTGTFYGMRTVIPHMRRSGGGSIVNLSSIWGNVGAAGVSAYQAAKGAVRTLSKNAAVTYADHNIRVNSLHPGLVDTPLIAGQDPAVTKRVFDATPMGRAAAPRELAFGALFLAGDESSFMTGAELVIDGGYLAV
ncbi:SDR family NAD(P)-dependent oxidoreductase [Mycolicibacterium wolinskyi]|uniref:SDR family NAD(P)-dependent oxidoreductase n=1 Tax=Mycolicibacterium wolinskyi TaxID=59750 RepID=UPI0039176C79